MLEAHSVDMYNLLSKTTKLTWPPFNTLNLLNNVPRPIQHFTNDTSNGYMKFIGNLFDVHLIHYFVLDEYADNKAYKEINHHFSNMFLNSRQAIPQGAMKHKNDMCHMEKFGHNTTHCGQKKT